MNIYVGNIPYHATEEDLRQAFGEFGNVTAANIVIDKMTGRSRGFAFVEMAGDEEGKRAISEMNGKDWEGRTLTVNEARPRTEGRREGGGYSGGGGARRSGGGGYGGGGGRSDYGSGGGYGGGGYSGGSGRSDSGGNRGGDHNRGDRDRGDRRRGGRERENQGYSGWGNEDDD